MSDQFQDHIQFQDLPPNEGLFDEQLSLPLPSLSWAPSVAEIVKRNGKHERFDKTKIAGAIRRAMQSINSGESDIADSIASAVAIYLAKRLQGQPASADQVSDSVERVLIQMAYADIALAYARYRDRRARIRRLRNGDMRALLGEIEEARHERECASALDPGLRVRTSQDSLVEWDRNRIVDVLEQETGLSREMSVLIAAEVELQIQNAGIRILTTPLVRELVGAKLIEHGLLEENELRRRLGVPLYDASRIIRGATPETVGRDPAATDHILAKAVKKEYALSEVFSQSVTHAHLTGEIHLYNLAQVDRLSHGDHCLACLAAHGIRLNTGAHFADPPHHPETLLAQLVKFTDILGALFSGPIRWHAFNYFVAPFVHSLDNNALHQFCEMLLYECSYRSVSETPNGAPMRLSLCWDAPEEWAALPAIGPGGQTDEKTYKAFEPTARRLAWSLLKAFERGGINDASFPAPILDIVLNESSFTAYNSADFLRCAAAAALKRPGIHFALSPHPNPSPVHIWRPRRVVWHRVALNMPRIALHAEQFNRQLERVCQTAIQAHVEKRDFIESLLDPHGNAPLAALALEKNGVAYLDNSNSVFMLAVDGLFECAQVMQGLRGADFDGRIRFMEEVLGQLKTITATLAKQEGLPCLMAANAQPEVSRRFAALDIASFPNIADPIIKIDPATQAMAYTTGVALPPDLHLNPFEQARIEGTMHRHLDERPFTRIALPMRNTSENALLDLLGKLVRETDCGGIMLDGQEERAS